MQRRDFLHKLSDHYAREYDLVAVEDLDAKGLVKPPGNSRNRAGAAWGTFLRMLEYECEREGTHFVAVNPRETTKECASCGVSTEKPLWVGEHSCPACGFELDRDANAVARLRLAGSQKYAISGNGVEYSFSRSTTTMSSSLRINVPRNHRFLVCKRIARFVNACGDCAPCGYVRISKAWRGNRKPHSQRTRASG